MLVFSSSSDCALRVRQRVHHAPADAAAAAGGAAASRAEVGDPGLGAQNHQEPADRRRGTMGPLLRLALLLSNPAPRPERILAAGPAWWVSLLLLFEHAVID